MATWVKGLGSAMAVLALVLAGCKSQPVYEVVASPITPAPGVKASLDSVRLAIVRGGTKAGWTVSPETPGRMIGTFVQGQHSATVSIEHDTKSYSIRYKDSVNLGAASGAIHQAYNAWVQNLDRSIRTELIVMQ